MILVLVIEVVSPSEARLDTLAGVVNTVMGVTNSEARLDTVVGVVNSVGVASSLLVLA